MFYAGQSTSTHYEPEPSQERVSSEHLPEEITKSVLEVPSYDIIPNVDDREQLRKDFVETVSVPHSPESTNQTPATRPLNNCECKTGCSPIRVVRNKWNEGRWLWHWSTSVIDVSLIRLLLKMEELPWSRAAQVIWTGNNWRSRMWMLCMHEKWQHKLGYTSGPCSNHVRLKYEFQWPHVQGSTTQS